MELFVKAKFIIIIIINKIRKCVKQRNRKCNGISNSINAKIDQWWKERKI